MLTEQKIAELLASPPPGGLQRGKLAYWLTNAKTSAEKTLLQALVDQPTLPQGSYRHPQDDPDARRALTAGKTVTLDDSDRAWLAGLPAADQVTYSDAVALARMANQVKRGSADDRLVNSKWDAVKARHDLAQAREALDRARDPWPTVPEAAAYPAIAEAVRAKTSDMTDNAIGYYASELVRDAIDRRADLRARAIDAAARRVAQLEADDLQRRSTSAPAA